MSLISHTKKRLLDLAEGRVEPESGMEKHFLLALEGKARACTPEEKEWVAFCKAKLESPRREMRSNGWTEPSSDDEGQYQEHPQQAGQTRTGKLCIDCLVPIPVGRLEISPNATRCIKCQEEFEKTNPQAVTRRADEGIVGWWKKRGNRWLDLKE